MKRHAFTLAELLIVIAIVAVLAAFLWPTFTCRTSPQSAQRSSCQSNLKQIGLAFKQYQQDFTDKLPITTTAQGWVGALQPYLKSYAIFKCHSEATRKNDKLTHYWFNRRLAGVEDQHFDAPALTILTVEGEPSDDPNISLLILPPLWIAKADSPLLRHLDGANYGFADGHVKWMTPDKITVEPTDKGKPTFLMK